MRLSRLAAAGVLPLLLTADFSFAHAGLGLWAPITTSISVLGLGILLLAAYVLLFKVAIRPSVPSQQRLRPFFAVGTVLAVALGGWVIHAAIFHFVRPIAERQAWEMLSHGLDGSQSFMFDSGLTVDDRKAILSSTQRDWRLAFSNTLIVGYDFVLMTGTGRTLGARVVLPSLLRPKGKLWAYEETTFSPRRAH